MVELGEKHAGRFTDESTQELIEEGKRWLAAGAVRLVVEARESAEDVGLFSAPGEFDALSLFTETRGGQGAVAKKRQEAAARAAVRAGTLQPAREKVAALPGSGAPS